ncbi:glycosyltransferase family 4 protein [Porticoccus sp.]|nr:glycosyltransferase family 4 protein [Porticoccus sp.]
MRILVVTQYFWPESFIINQLVTTLAEKGHHLVVLTGKPNYPEGEVYPGYQKYGIQHEMMGDIQIIRVPLRPRKSANASSLILNYLSFVWSGLIYFPFLVKNKQFDEILVFAPSPITSAIPAILLKYIKRVHLSIWVQDLWPESLYATGFIKNKIVLKSVSFLVKFIYAAADTLLVQSKAFIKPVSTLSNKDKIVYFPNAMNNIEQVNYESSNLLSPYLEDCLDKYFSFVFAGNIGKAQSIETLISAAQQLSNFPNIRILVVGSGSMLDWAKNEVQNRALKNIVFTGSFPIEVMPPIFAKAKALLVTLNSSEIFKYTIPSKVQAYMNAGRPIIASINGETARVIQEAGAGLICPAEDHKALAARIVQFYNMSESERDIIGNNSKRYFLENYEMHQQCEKLIEILQQKIELKRQKDRH